jgi:arylsulfatase A-like enzyme
MMLRPLVCLLIALSPASLPAAVTDSGLAQRPNVVLVMSDDQGWGQTGYNGHPLLKTPHLDAMAAAGLRFNRFYAAAPVCSPTRASVLTGRTNRRTGVETHGYALRRQEITLATLLQRAGYATGHFGKWHLNGLRGPGAPVLANDTHHPGVFGFDEWLSVTNFFDINPIMSRNGTFEEFSGDSSEVTVAEAVRFMRQQWQAGKPFLAVIWYGTPHDPFVAGDSDMADFRQLDERTRRQLGELVAMDRSIGELRSALREMGAAAHTLVWFTSDNGGLPRMNPETTGGLRGYKRSLYEGGLRVPAVIEWPGVIEPRVTDFPAVSMDIVPTVAEITGIETSALIQPQDGVSLRALFQRELEKREKPIPFSFLNQFVLINNHIKAMYVGEENPRYELYDLATDPGETTNLINDRPEMARDLRLRLERLRESLQSSIEGKDYPEGGVNAGEPQPHSWMEDARYEPFLDAWKDRPEYRGWLKRR